MGHDDVWMPGCRQVEFVTDCQVLAGIANGKSMISHDSNHAKALRCIINGLGALIQSGLHTRTAVLDPISWRPRARNKHADAACNLAMDMHQDFTWAAPDGRELVRTLQALQIFSDSGVRDLDVCAASNVIYIWTKQDGSLVRKTLFIKGLFVASRLTPFGAEVLALRTALRDIMDLVGVSV